MKKLLTLAVLVFISFGVYAQERPYTKMEVYFKGTNYELSVYHIYGRRDGKTMFILGGIQGDEPGGFLSADLYSDLRLEQGNLIVIPRANFKSVILYDRGPDGDMNRRFLDSPEAMEMDRVVSVVKELMAESDVFLNLHDGWGYHNPKYIDSSRNPKKFGQAIITDADSFKCESGKTIDLVNHAKQVLAEVNRKIGTEKYHLQYFNTDTENPKTEFSDMRKTATYYALRKFCIPAYGIESSKNLPTTEMKVLHHNYAVNEFMKIYGIVPEVPSIILDKPRLDFAVINVNGEPHKIAAGGTLKIKSGDVVEIVHAESNYERGISADFVGYGTLNDLNSKFAVKRDGVIIFRKDSRKISSINISAGRETVKTEQKPVQRTAVNQAEKTEGTKYTFLIKKNGETVSVESGETLEITAGTMLELISLKIGDTVSGYPINLKGYVAPNIISNNGDDRGIEILLNPDRFMTKYAEDAEKMKYPVVVSAGGREIAKFWVKMK